MSRNRHKTQYPRTLLIGLGRSGKDILLNVREDTIRSNNAIPNSFLFIDADSSISSIRKPFTDLSSNDFLALDGKNEHRFNLFSNGEMPGLKRRFPNTVLSPQYVNMLKRSKSTDMVGLVKTCLCFLSFFLDRSSSQVSKSMV